MFGVGTGEILLILVIAMLVVGPERMVEFSRTMGRMIVQLRHTTDEATKEFREAFAVDELKELKKELESGVVESSDVAPAATPALPAPESPGSAGASAPAEVSPEPAETVTLKEVLGDELVDGEIEVEPAAETPATIARSEPAAEASEAISIELTSLVPEDPDVAPTIIETAEMVPQEPVPSPEAAED